MRFVSRLGFHDAFANRFELSGDLHLLATQIVDTPIQVLNVAEGEKLVMKFVQSILASPS
ncbi:hypothetical protein KDL45_11685 [bacterium]|nr:hypothetical protein [bacterium]